MKSFRVWLLLLPLLVPAARAERYVLLVANRGTPAEAAGKKLADGEKVFFEVKLFKALDKAAELLKAGEHTVTVKVAGGQQHTSQGNSGSWTVPQIVNPKGTLVIAGGYDGEWAKRDPFALASELVTVRGRGAVLEFSPKSKLAKLVVSGLHFDAAPSNSYDVKTNSLLKADSRSLPLVAFQSLATAHLVVADNVFLNGAHTAVNPYITPAGDASRVDIVNNLFLNNVMLMKTQTGGWGLKTLNIKGNSFILNWPFNPDPTSSNVGALELYHSECCEELNIESNLFAFNPGGAMQHDWPEKQMPKLHLKKNLFFTNATLFGDGRGDAGLFVGKFGKSPKHLVITVEQAADDYSYDMDGNVSFDPKVPVALVDLQAADSSGVQAKKTAMNDLRGLFGVNKQGGTVAIANYAPRLAIDSQNLPFPTDEKARAYGAARERVVTLE